MSKRILLISPLPPPQGGIATWTHEMLRTGLPDGSTLSLVDTRIRSKRNIFDPSKFSLAEVKRTSRVLGALCHQFIFKRPQVVHINSSISTLGIFRDFACAILAKLFRLPVVTHYHGNLPDFRGKRFFGLSYRILRNLMEVSSINIVENKGSLAVAKKILGHDKSVILLPNFIFDDIFKLSATETDHPIRAIFAGGITRTKGCAEILAVAKALPEIEFHLYGKLHDDMATLYKTALPNLFLHGVVSHDVLLKAMTKSDFLLFPSYSEGFPMTVLEAMAIGLPVIGTEVGAIPEMVKHTRGGFLVAPKEVKGLIDAIKVVSSDQQLKHAMGQYNRQKCFNEYRYSIVITQLMQLYHQLIG